MKKRELKKSFEYKGYIFVLTIILEYSKDHRGVSHFVIVNESTGAYENSFQIKETGELKQELVDIETECKNWADDLEHHYKEQNTVDFLKSLGYKEEDKKEQYVHGIVPKDSSYKNSKIYNDLKNIPGTSIDMVKGIVFLDGDRKKIQQYLDNNRDLFEYTE